MTSIDKPSLKSAYLRVDRAKEHLAELQRIHDEVCAAQAHAIVMKPNANLGSILPDTPTPLCAFQLGDTPIPDRINVLTGDTAVSLRSALNYLVGQLSLLDSGRKGKRTQFPIESTPEGFQGHRRIYLEGVSTAHVAVIEELQPYKGCQWTEPLQRLSNLDKHDDLVIIVHDYSLSGVITVGETKEGQAPFDMKVKLEPLLHIALGDGMPLVETLEIVKSQVTQTLDSFNSLFQ